MKKVVHIAFIILILCLCGCDENNADITQPIISRTELTPFEEIDYAGNTLWYQKWYDGSYYRDIPEPYTEEEKSKDQWFLLNGKASDCGLGFDGLSTEETDEFAYAKYEIREGYGPFREISCIFCFDDRTEIKPDTYLTIWVDDVEVFKSEPINNATISIPVNIPLAPESRTIAFRIDTEKVGETFPKIVLYDLVAHQAN